MGPAGRGAPTIVDWGRTGRSPRPPQRERLNFATTEESWRSAHIPRRTASTSNFTDAAEALGTVVISGFLRRRERRLLSIEAQSRAATDMASSSGLPGPPSHLDALRATLSLEHEPDGATGKAAEARPDTAASLSRSVIAGLEAPSTPPLPPGKLPPLD